VKGVWAFPFFFLNSFQILFETLQTSLKQ
jgi:hypothetical protein